MATLLHGDQKHENKTDCDIPEILNIKNFTVEIVALGPPVCCRSFCYRRLWFLSHINEEKHQFKVSLLLTQRRILGV